MKEVKSELKWYLVKVQSNHEKSVSQRLKLELSRINENESKVLVPVEKTFFIKNGKRVFREKIVYPGYLFVETSHPGEISQLLKLIPGTSGFVKNKSGSYEQVKQEEINRINNYVEISNDKSLLTFSVGEMVKIIDTAFDGFTGTIEEVNEEKQKLKVIVKIFGKGTVVDLDMIQVEKQ